MLTVIVAGKALTEIALMLLFGRLLLALLARSPARPPIAVYQLFELLTAPVLRVARWITPRIVLDRHLPWVAGAWLLCAWVALTAAKIYLIRIAPVLSGG